MLPCAGHGISRLRRLGPGRVESLGMSLPRVPRKALAPLRSRRLLHDCPSLLSQLSSIPVRGLHLHDFLRLVTSRLVRLLTILTDLAAVG